MKSKQKQSKQETPKQAAAAKKTKKTDDKKAFKRPEPVKGALKPAKKQVYTFDFTRKPMRAMTCPCFPLRATPSAITILWSA